MTGKKLYTRAQFESLRNRCAAKMATDHRLQKKALDVLIHADRHRWIHQTTWMGEPILNLPQDMFAIQELIYRTRPEYIVECGVAWGGALLFYASLLELLGGAKVIGIDIYIPPDLRRRLKRKGKVSKRIALINGSSVEEGTIDQVKQITGKSSKVMVILDSFHTHDHVLKELRLYSQLVGKGQYLVCGDTIVESIPAQRHRPRPWGPGSNPMTALKAFMKENNRFAVNQQIEKKLLFTCNPGGFLKRCRD